MCLTIKNQSAGRRARRAGSTLVEYIVAAGVGSLILLAVVPLTLYSGYNFAAMANYADLNASSLNAVDQMTTEIRQAAQVTAFTTNQVTLNMGTNRPPLVYAFSPNTRTLTRQELGNSKVILREVDTLEFAMFQRNPKPGMFEHYSTTNITDGRVLTVKWNCSRRLFGARISSESMEAARIVLRKN
jgi:hypothetical protein